MTAIKGDAERVIKLNKQSLGRVFTELITKPTQRKTHILDQVQALLRKMGTKKVTNYPKKKREREKEKSKNPYSGHA